jgi:dUTP pyrophosphatase
MIHDLPFKRHSETAKAPSKAYHDDAAFDLFADHDAILGWSSTPIKTNVAVAIPPGYGGILMGRSGLGKASYTALGFVFEKDGVYRLGGMIDSGYTDPIIVMLAGISPQSAREVKRGDAIAQLLIVPIPDLRPVDVGDGDLPRTVRGGRGFGSSDGRPDIGAGRFYRDVETDRALWDEWERKGRPILPPLGSEWTEVARAIREAPEDHAPIPRGIIQPQGASVPFPREAEYLATGGPYDWDRYCTWMNQEPERRAAFWEWYGPPPEPQRAMISQMGLGYVPKYEDPEDQIDPKTGTRFKIINGVRYELILRDIVEIGGTPPDLA